VSRPGSPTTSPRKINFIIREEPNFQASKLPG
jgi:hypothetical protein